MLFELFLCMNLGFDYLCFTVEMMSMMSLIEGSVRINMGS